ncbi:sensor histidine kinase [Prolixibacter sp. SD074]|uniref:sensor histidine kinase n=1 Tax=Prolixibacter sp. SD074 TaxID=2652391 RepID=UPI00127779C8|nr:histidine kinase [Prolixibacter sp. SD074]GET29819.1 histidine kinase [Prolixibacter sp. SD074]
MLYFGTGDNKEGIMSNKFRFTLIRLGIVSLLALLTLQFVNFILTPTQNPLNDSYPYILAIIGFNLLSEGNILINRYLDQKTPWFFRIVPRVLKQAALSLLWTAVVGIAMFIVLPGDTGHPNLHFRGIILTYAFGAIFVLIFNSILFLRSFFSNWRNSLIENEKLKQEKLKSEYRILQNQMNPHFLFNSLSVLISEIRYNPAKAEEFARKIADVYRYVLQRRDDETITLDKELEFTEKFIFLHKIRLGDAVFLENQIEPDLLKYRIPPFTLQILVENALKHNRATQKEPLHILMKTDAEKMMLEMRNNRQEKKTTYSSGTGLNNLSDRYRLLSGKTIKIVETEAEFAVQIPLLD